MLLFPVLVGLFFYAFRISAPLERRYLRKKLLLIAFGASALCCSIWIIDVCQRTPFFNAVQEGRLDQVKEMLTRNPSLIRSETLMGTTALHMAVLSNNIDMVRLLIKEGADVNAPGYVETPLHVAAFYGHAKIAEILLNAGANVNALGYKQDDTPLQVAAIHGNSDVIKVLLLHGASVNAEDKDHETAHQLAQEYNQTNVVDILAKANSTPQQ
jgi:ankyrin repeat protein